MTGESDTSRRPWWLNRTAMVSLVGLALSALFAGLVGWYIPRRVADDFLASQAVADQAALDFLVSSDVVSTGSDMNVDDLDRFVRQSILRGDFVRAKLWSLDGTVLYSDARELIGQRFAPDEDFESLTTPISEVSDLSEEENYLEAGQFGALLETYVPVLDGERVLAVWEIYRTLDAYDASVDQTQRLVWITFGSGLGLLGLFLVSTLGSLVRVADEQRRSAESRADDLVTLLEVARTTTQADSPEGLAARLRSILESAPQVEWAIAVLQSDDPEPRRLLEVGSPARDLGEPRAQEESSAGLLTVHIEPTVGSATDPTIDALAEEVLVGLQKALLAEGLDDYRRQLERVMEQLVDAEDSERRRLAGDVHDSVARDLYRILYGVRTLAADAPASAQPALAELEAAILEASGSLRNLLRDLYPTVAEDVGLAASLASLAERVAESYDLAVDLDIDRCPEPSRDVKLAVYRVAQEALVNAARHSGSDRATLAVWAAGDQVEFTISDHGAGPPIGWRAGMGIWLMRDRVERLGGHIGFDAGDGLIVRGSIPMGGAS